MVKIVKITLKDDKDIFVSDFQKYAGKEIEVCYEDGVYFIPFENDIKLTIDENGIKSGLVDG